MNRYIVGLIILVYVMLAGLLVQSQSSLEHTRELLRNGWAREDALHGMITDLRVAYAGCRGNRQ